MTPFAKYLFLFLLNNTGPGKSVYSMELLPQCGADPLHASCDLNPVCSTPSPLCAAPEWNKWRSGWARAETRETAAARYMRAANMMYVASTHLTGCVRENGSVDQDCTLVPWRGGPRSLSCMMATIAIYESGMREDIMGGYPPAGRGSAGEVCVMQIMPKFIGHDEFTPWMAPEDRDLPLEDRVSMVLGSDERSLQNCFETGGRILARKRRNSHYACKGIQWDYATIAFYGTGNRCYVSEPTATEKGVESGQLNPVMLGNGKEDWVAKRASTYRECMNHWPDKERTPDWVKPMLEK